LLKIARFDDCFRLGKRIDEGPYLLPDPEYLLKAPEAALKVPSSQQLEGAVSTIPTGPYETENSEKLVVFAQKKVMLSQDHHRQNYKERRGGC
jgi:hypothetical protein